MDNWPRTVDNRPHFVDRSAEVVDNNSGPVAATEGNGRQPKTTESTRSVRSAARPIRAGGRERIDRGEVENLRHLNAMTERELLEARGVCGRCAGAGYVPSSDFLRYPYLRSVSCPRCGGTGVKGGVR